MRKIQIKNIKQDENKEIILFVLQRLDEMLFFYTKDTYKVKIFNTKILLSEYMHVMHQIDEDIIAEKNEEYIMEEIQWSLANDKEAVELIGVPFYKNFQKNHGSLTRKARLNSIQYCLECLGNTKYLEKIKENLKNSIRSKEKREIDRLLQQFICETKSIGYDTRYIYSKLNQIFVGYQSVSIESIEQFIDSFTVEEKKFDVIISEEKELAEYSIKALNAFERKVSILDEKEISNEGLIYDNERLFIRLTDLTAFDEYALAENIKSLLKSIESFYLFYRHNGGEKEQCVYVKVGEKYKKIDESVKGVKKSAKVSSRIKSSKLAKELFVNSLFGDTNNLYLLSRIMEIHNTAMKMDSASNALLDLWSIFELLLEKDSIEANRSRIEQIIMMVKPFLIKNYVHQLITYLIGDFKRCNESLYSQTISDIKEGNTNEEKLFIFLSNKDYETNRKLLYGKLDENPLLRYRLFTISESVKDGKSIKKLIDSHVQKITWQIIRIYRARNCIIHDGEKIPYIDDLVENLHNYIDELCKGLIDMITEPQSVASINTALYSHYINIDIYMSKLSEEYKECSSTKMLYCKCD